MFRMLLVCYSCVTGMFRNTGEGFIHDVVVLQKLNKTKENNAKELVRNTNKYPQPPIISLCLKCILNLFVPQNLVFELGEFDRERILHNWSVQQGPLFKSWITRAIQPNGYSAFQRTSVIKQLTLSIDPF